MNGQCMQPASSGFTARQNPSQARVDVGPLDRIGTATARLQKHNAELVTMIERLEQFTDRLSGPAASDPRTDAPKADERCALAALDGATDDQQGLLCRLLRVVSRLN